MVLKEVGQMRSISGHETEKGRHDYTLLKGE